MVKSIGIKASSLFFFRSNAPMALAPASNLPKKMLMSILSPSDYKAISDVHQRHQPL